MSKSKSLGKLSEEVAVLLQLLVRLKASDDNGYCSCVTCGVIKHYKDGMQGGHFISRKYTRTKLLEENIHPQCQGCNGFKHGDMVNYTLFMIDTYGREFVDELEIEKNQTKKWDRVELEELKKDFKEQIKYHEGRVL